MPLSDKEYEDDNLSEMESPKEEEEEIHFFHIGYMCEDCDYKWKAKRKAFLSDEDRTGSDRWVVDDSTMDCPMCGSSNITRF